MPYPSDSKSKVQPWTRISGEITYQDRWIKVRSDKCRTAEGAVIEPYHVLEYPDWINVIALTRHEHKLLLANEYRHGIGEVVLGLVSGGVEQRDLDSADDPFEAAARRELEEETGYRGGDFHRILTSFPNPANHSNRVVSFLALNVEAGGIRSFDQEGSEFIETIAADLPEVLRQLRQGDIQMQAMHVAALWSAAAAILSSGEITIPSDSLKDRLREAMGAGERKP